MSVPAPGVRFVVEQPGQPILEVRRATSEEDLLDVLEIRRLVFGIEQRAPDLRVSDADDARSLIAIASIRTGTADHEARRAVATGRLTPWPPESGPALIAWVATLQEHRSLGIGHEVMRFLLSAADTAGVRQVALAAQTPALRFYQRLGFLTTGPRYDVRGIPHVRMIRRPS